MDPRTKLLNRLFLDAVLPVTLAALALVLALTAQVANVQGERLDARLASRIELLAGTIAAGIDAQRSSGLRDHVGRGSGALPARNQRAPRSDVLERRQESRCDGVTALSQSRDVEVCHEGTCSQVAYPSDRIGHRDRAGVGGGRIRRRVALGARTVRCDERRHALSLARRIVAKETEREVHSPRHDDSYGQCGLLGRAVRSAV